MGHSANTFLSGAFAKYNIEFKFNSYHEIPFIVIKEGEIVNVENRGPSCLILYVREATRATGTARGGHRVNAKIG